MGGILQGTVSKGKGYNEAKNARGLLSMGKKENRVGPEEKFCLGLLVQNEKSARKRTHETTGPNLA